MCGFSTLSYSLDSLQTQVDSFLTTYPVELAHTPQIKGSFPQNYPQFRCQLQVWASHTSDVLAINQGFPLPPSRFHNLLAQLTELRKAFYLLRLAYYKGYNSGIAQFQSCTEQVIRGEEEECAVLPRCPRGVHHPPSFATSTNLEALPIPLFRIFIKVGVTD